MLQLFERYKLLIFVIALALASIGCQVSSQAETPTLFPSHFPTVISTITQTLIPTIRATIKPTRTPTLTIPKVTATATPIEIWTPIPTLSTTAALERIQELYVNTKPCEIPCWWAITPGKTTWAQARQELSKIGPESGPYFKGVLPRYDYSFEVPANFEPLNLDFIEPSLYVQNMIVVAIGTSTGWLHQDFDYSLANLLTLFGQPDEIWLRYSPVEADFHIEYSLNLFYKERGILLHKSGEAELRDNTLVICPLQGGKFPMGITLFDPTITDSYDYLRELLFGKYELTETRYSRINTVTDGVGESEFYELFRNEDTAECFSVHVE